MTKEARIKLAGDVSVDIIDPDNVRPVYADLVTEIRIVDGTLCLSLATVVIEGSNPNVTHSARICARLRIAPHTVQFLKQAFATPQQASIPEGQTIN
jgi:hypothetical protein